MCGHHLELSYLGLVEKVSELFALSASLIKCSYSRQDLIGPLRLPVAAGTNKQS